MNNIEKIGIGTTAVIAQMGVTELPLGELMQVITQIVIAIGTLIAIFKKKK